jgi:hypothetical protein
MRSLTTVDEILFGGRWSAVTALGIYLCVLISILMEVGGLLGAIETTEKSVRAALIFALGGAVYGVLQWAVLRYYIMIKVWWIIAAAIGWGIGAIVGLHAGKAVVYGLLSGYGTGAYIMGPSDFLHMLVIGFTGTTIYGIISATALVIFWHTVRPRRRKT